MAPFFTSALDAYANPRTVGGLLVLASFVRRVSQHHRSGDHGQRLIGIALDYMALF